MKKNLLLSLISILLIISIGIGVSYYFYYKRKSSNPQNNEYKYLITFFDDKIPGTNYKFYFDSDYNVKVEETPSCSTKECLDGTKKPETKTYNVTLSENNKNNLKQFAQELFTGKSSNELNLSNIDYKSKEYKILKALISNDEKRIELEIEPYEYRISYGYGYQTTYIIYLNKENNIKIKEAKTIRDFELSTIKTWDLSFSRENKTLVANYLKNKFTDSKETELDINRPLGDDLIVLQSIIKNSETRLSNLNKTELLFTLNKNGTSAYIYSDNTYIYYNTEGKEYNSYSEGTLKVNGADILNNINSYKTDTSNTFIKTPTNEMYYLDINNETIINLINSIPNFGSILAVD